MRILLLGIALLVGNCTTTSVHNNLPIPQTETDTEAKSNPDTEIETSLDESTACVEEIIEAEHDYIIARILHSFDEDGQKIDERLVDLHPDHHDDMPCYQFFPDRAYSRYIHTWSYDSDGRTLQERYVDLGDYAFCGRSTASQNDSTWVFSTSGLLIEENHNYTKENMIKASRTEYQYTNDGLLSVKSHRQSGGYSSFVERWTYDDTRPQEKESIDENNAGDRFLSTTSWAYSDSGDLLTKIEKKSQALDENSGFRSVEERIYGENAKVIVIRSDSHSYPLHSNYGPLGADGIYDFSTEYTYDNAGQLLTEKSYREANGSLNASMHKEKSWEYDEQGRVVRETFSNPHQNAPFNVREHQFTYSDFGLLSKMAFDIGGILVYEAYYTYDALGRQTTVTSVNNAGETSVLHHDLWEYDESNRISRWRRDTNGDGNWDEERRFSYACEVDFTKLRGFDSAEIVAVPAPL